MTHIFKIDLDFVCFYLLFYYYHQNHLCLTINMSNSSTPGFKAMTLQDHLHCTEFKHKLLYIEKNNSSTSKNIVDAEEKANGNNVDSQEHKRQLT